MQFFESTCHSPSAKIVRLLFAELKPQETGAARSIRHGSISAADKAMRHFRQNCGNFITIAWMSTCTVKLTTCSNLERRSWTETEFCRSKWGVKCREGVAGLSA
jgi:hypothetical protein